MVDVEHQHPGQYLQARVSQVPPRRHHLYDDHQGHQQSVGEQATPGLVEGGRRLALVWSGNLAQKWSTKYMDYFCISLEYFIRSKFNLIGN